MTTIINNEATTTITMEQIKSWMTDNAIDITTGMSLTPDNLGYVKEFTTAETLSEAQITLFEETFFNKRLQGNMGKNVISAETIILTEGNLTGITDTNTISYIETINWKKGSIVSLKFFDGGITLNHNASDVHINSAAMFLGSETAGLFTEGSTLTLIYDGAHWREIARMMA